MRRLIEEGEIAGSVGIARAAALESFERPYHCIVATRILKRLNDDAGLKAVAAHSLAHVDKLGAELAPALAVELFPNYFSVDDLLAIIALSTPRSEEHTSELQSLMRISYAVFCLKKKKHNTHNQRLTTNVKEKQVNMQHESQ